MFAERLVQFVSKVCAPQGASLLRLQVRARLTKTHLHSFAALGLRPEASAAAAALGLATPTPSQRAGIPPIAHGKSILLCGVTGDGKTLAYVLPLVSRLKDAEVAGSLRRRAQRPAAVILAPSRELGAQILATVKTVGHTAKVSSAALLGGGSRRAQRQRLASPVDILVATPGRLAAHLEAGDVFLTDASTLVFDEADVLAGASFANDLARLLAPLERRTAARERQAEILPAMPPGEAPHEFQVVAVTASCTAAAERVARQWAKRVGAAPPRAVEAAGAHRAAQKLQVILEDAGENRAAVLARVMQKVLQVPGASRTGVRESCTVECEERASADSGAASRSQDGDLRSEHAAPLEPPSPCALIFCNTVRSARFAEHSLRERGIAALSLHGEMPRAAREEAIRAFRTGSARALVATDVASRGLDFPHVSHVILFDIPTSHTQLLHRAGRTARAGKAGVLIGLVNAAQRRELSRLMRGPGDAMVFDVADEVDGPTRTPKKRTQSPRAKTKDRHSQSVKGRRKYSWQ